MSSSTLPTPLKILMLHGFTQTASLFRAKTRALEKALSKALAPRAVELVYLDGPHRLSASDIAVSHNAAEDESVRESAEQDDAAIDARAWWRRKDVPPEGGGPVYEGLEQGLAEIAQCIRAQGPFDGVIGFSQGACATGMVTALLEGASRRTAMDDCAACVADGYAYPTSFLDHDEFVQGPLKFAVVYSGFRAPAESYSGMYVPKICTPVLHVLGALDTLVDEARARTLVDACENNDGRVIVHPGGHFVPSQKPWLDAVCVFVKQYSSSASDGSAKAKPKDARVEDMDVPF